MAPKVDRVRSDEHMPDSAHVVIIGGGVIGVTTAFFLARAGVSVVLCEKGEIAAEQSSRNWGWTRVMGRDERELPLGQLSLELWRNLSSLTGRETGFRQCGILYACDDQKQLDEFLAWKGIADRYQIRTSILDGARTAEMAGGAQRPFKGGLYCPTDGRAEPTMAVPAIAEAARGEGAAILTHCAVRTLDRQGGRVSGVVTERGTIRCDTVVLAGGAWSRLFAGNEGIDLPALNVLGSVMRVDNVEGAPEESVGGSDFAFRRNLQGGYNISRRNASVSEITPDTFRQFHKFIGSYMRGRKELRLRLGRRFLDELRMRRRWSADSVTPFEQIRILDPEPTHDLLEEAARVLKRDFPPFRTMREVERWGGMIDVTPDAVPIIGEVGSLPGLVLGTGFSGHGFGIGPGAGKLLSEIVTGARPSVDLAPFRYDRF
ncbi:FAD-binding oxidoreductase [Gluconacetobacter azotocaptans]|uniref:NAD(P)/FAD-dependent oxidoreductase n=1 Tax=Gluconacetobacter azotocaptans TaxID=142834 RepID=UPI0019568444|nr:FAD-binding oxidoreductase [Gluconacetobacter azotocaptans]MBM9400762.1 FAD-binding oxidoreductase [Gluconacetobacter azotocaptans]